MSLETLEKVYNALAFEPQTPNEIASKIHLNQKTVRANEYQEKCQMEKNRKIQGILEGKVTELDIPDVTKLGNEESVAIECFIETPSAWHFKNHYSYENDVRVFCDGNSVHLLVIVHLPLLFRIGLNCSMYLFTTINLIYFSIRKDTCNYVFTHSNYS
jgi:hypothetical protein